MFASSVKKIEGDNITAIEIVQQLCELDHALKMRREDEFLSPNVAAEKNTLIESGYDSVLLANICKEFFGNFSRLQCSPMNVYCILI